MLRCALLLVVGCVDQPVELQPWRGGAPTSRLSELGLFDDAVAQAPAAGVVAYDVIAPLWSDGASKLRFIASQTPLGVSDDHWTISDGTYLVKTFWFPLDERAPDAGRRLIETRVIAFHGGDVDAATYVWNDDQTEAYASGGNIDIAVRWLGSDGASQTQVHHVPGTTQCDACHDGGALGIRTPQLAPQIDALVALGVASGTPAAIAPFLDPYADGPVAERALSYLDANCGHCHRPGGDAQGTGVDWRREHALANICRDAARSFGSADRVIEPGAPERSVAISRMRSTDAFIHMPRGPSHVIDTRGLAVVEDWIRSLPTGCR